MLWDNNGSSTDVINAFADELGDGNVMDSFRSFFTAGQEGKLTREKAELGAVAARVHECERKVHNETGMVPDFSIPLHLYHKYPIDFMLAAEKAGITLEFNGYECWDCEEFKAWFRKNHPELVFKEAPRAPTIVLPANWAKGGLVA